MAEVIRVGTRRSPLALAQTEQVIELLKRASPDTRFEIVKIVAAGDEDVRWKHGTMTGKDMFTRAIEERLLRAEIDLAVHSLKDMPARLHPELVIAAIPLRGDPRDALVSASGMGLKQLPQGARVGTSSLRRRAQLLAHRPDLTIVELHGNVGTRLRKLREEGLDAIILAAAGLERLGLSGEITEILPTEVMLPAAGQGALAVEARRDDSYVIKIAEAIDDVSTRRAVEAERYFAEEVGGGCNTPVAAYAKIEDGMLILDGMVASPDGSKLMRDSVAGDSENPRAVAAQLVQKLAAKGALEIVGGGA